VLIDEEDARYADIFVHARPFFDGRRLHGAANRQCSGAVETQKTPVREERSRAWRSVYDARTLLYQGARYAVGAKEFTACAT